MLARAVNAICFWLLAAMGLFLFAITVMKPPWDDLKRHQQTEKAMEEVKAQLDERARANQYQIGLLDPAKPDPLMVDKLAREILNFELGKGADVPIRPIGTVQMPEPLPPADVPADEPGPAARIDLLDRQLSPAVMRKLNNPKIQRLQLLMAGIAISMAFIFFGTPTRQPRPEEHMPS